MDHELAVNEERRRRLRNLQGLGAIALWGTGCYLLHFAWSITQALPSPLNDALSTAIFYIFAFWPIQSLVERLFKGR
jgi:hypothetical protein